MEAILQNGWTLFCVSFGIMLVVLLIKHQQSRSFYTQDVVLRKFSIMDLELPASAQELANLVRGIFNLPVDQSQKTIKALKGHLYIDFIYMPATYGSIFLLCYIAAAKMSNLGHPLFVSLAWLQIIAWLCDITENIYLFKKINPSVVPSTPAVHKTYQAIEITKFGIALTGAVCSVFVFLYFWLVGKYHYISLHYLVIIIAEILLFVVAGKLLYEKSKENSDQ